MDQTTQPSDDAGTPTPHPGVRLISHECSIGAHGACYGTVLIYAVDARYLDPPIDTRECSCTHEECNCRTKAANR